MKKKVYKHISAIFCLLVISSCDKSPDSSYNKKFYGKTRIYEPEDYRRPFKNKNAEVLYLKGLQDFDNKQFRQAEDEYKKSLSIEKHPNTYNELGICYRTIYNIYESKNCFENAIKLDSTFSTAYFSLANLYANTNDYKNAEKLTRLLIKKSDNEFWKSYGYLHLSAIYNNLKKIKEAKIYLDSASELEKIPEFRTLYRNFRDTININLKKQ